MQFPHYGTSRSTVLFFFFQAEDGIRDHCVTGVQTCALPISPRFVLRDRDAIYGRDFAAMTRHMGREEVLTAPQSPLAKPLCGTASGLHPTRVPGPHYPVE